MNEYIYRELLDVDGNVVGREYGGVLIRCKDCKWWREESDHTCKHFYTSPRVANDFCSYAEPKEKRDDR